MNPNLISNIKTTLKSKKFWAFFAIFFVLVLALFASQYTLLEINTKNIRSNEPIKLKVYKDSNYENASTSTIKETENTKKILVPIGKITVEATSKDTKSRASVKTKPLRKNLVTIEIKHQTQSQKIYSNGMGCPVAFGSRIFSYDCFTGAKLTEHNLKTGLAEDDLAFRIFGEKYLYISHSVATEDGFFMLVNEPSQEEEPVAKLYFFNPRSNTAQVVPISDKLKSKFIGNESLRLKTDSTKTHAYLSFNGDVYSLSKTSGAKRIASLGSSIYSAKEDTIAVYNSTKTNTYHDISGEGENGEHTGLRPQLGEINVMLGGKKIGKTLDISGDVYNIELFGEKGLAVEKEDSVQLYQMGKNEFNLLTTISNVSNMTTADESIYYISNNGIYHQKEGEKTAVLIYESKSVTPANLKELNGDLYFGGAAKYGDKTYPYGFELVKKPFKNTARLEGMLDIINNNELNAKSLTINRNYISANLPLKSYDSTGGNITFDSGEFEQSKRSFLNKINKLGYDPSDFIIDFTPTSEITSIW